MVFPTDKKQLTRVIYDVLLPSDKKQLAQV